MWLTEIMHATRPAWPRREIRFTELKRANDDLHGYRVEGLLPMLKHGQWLSAINTTPMMDHHEHHPLMTSRTNMLRCATSHDLDSEKIFN